MIALLFLVAAADPTAIELGPVSLTPRAMLRPRFEIVPDRSLEGADPRIIVSHRVRVGAFAKMDFVSALVEIQDVRLWGSETVPVGLPNDPTVYGRVDGSLDLHQGYFGVHIGDVEARIGRQEILLGNERLIGNGDFNQIGRAFDAVRLLAQNENMSWSAFAAIVSSADAFQDNQNIGLAAVHAELKLAEWARLSPIVVVDGNATADKGRATFGTRFDGTQSAFGYDVDVYGQLTREPDGAILTGALLGARGTYSFDTMLHPKIGLQLHAISGSSDPVAREGLAPFETLFGTQHKFYGFADMFVNPTLHTRGHGLVQNTAFLWIHEGPWSAVTAFHVFSPFSYPAAALYGVEPDIVGTWKPSKHFALEAGTALFIPIDAQGENALGRGDQLAPWVYLQAVAQL